MEPLLFVPISRTDFVKELRHILADLSQELKKNEQEERCLTAKETCQYLGGISKVTLDAWSKKGLVKKHRIEKRVFYKYTEINEAIEKGIVNRYGRAAR